MFDAWQDDIVESDTNFRFLRPKIQYTISTYGWSGNELIIAALQDRLYFWDSCWVQSRRGGHYIFQIETT